MSREDENELLKSILQFALRMLQEHGEFHPFGAVLTRDAQVRMVTGVMSGDHPRPTAVLDMLVQGLREEIPKTNPRAAGVCLLVRMRDPRTGADSDAIQARLEDSEGNALNVYVPYRRNGSGQLEQGRAIGERGEPTLYPPRS